MSRIAAILAMTRRMRADDAQKSASPAAILPVANRIDGLVQQLRGTRRALMRAYLLHVAWFGIMCVFIGTHWSRHGLKFSVLLTLVTVPPVLFYTVTTHRLCRAIDPRARTLGLVPVLVTTFVLSPFESGLVLPAKNLLEANRILRKHAVVPPRPPKAMRGSDEERHRES